MSERQQDPRQTSVDPAALRKRAEEQAGTMEQASLSAQTPEAIQQMLHELRVHQIELEMQNESLRTAQAQIEAGMARYFDLYDLAPVGYCTISEKGIILETNLTFTTMLGVNRRMMIEKPFSAFILREDQDIYYLLRKEPFDTGKPQTCEFRMVRRDKTTFWASLQATALQNEDGTKRLRVTISDSSKQKIAQQKLRKSEEQYRLLTTQMQLGMALHEIICDDYGNPVDYRFINVNDRFEQITGLRKEDILEKTVLEVLPHTEKYWIEAYGKVALTGKSGQFENYSAELRRHYSVAAYSPKRGQFAVIIDDITERKEMERQIFNEKEKFKTTLLSVGDGVISTDVQGNVLIMNKSSEQLTGWTQEESIGKPVVEVFHTINEFTRERCENAVQKVLETGDIIGLGSHTLLISKDGIERPIEDRAAPIKDEKGNITGVVLVFRDFTEKKKRQDEIMYLSFHDHLTGLYNRRYFEAELKRLDTERNWPVTIVMGDVNGLKLINDSFGHATGDHLLVRAAEVIKKACRADDIISRTGGDEFVILLPKTDDFEVEKLIKRINNLLKKERVGEIEISISFGYASKSSEADEIEAIFKTAEDMMYHNKLFEGPSIRGKAINNIVDALIRKSKREDIHSKHVSELCGRMGRSLGLEAYKIKEIEALGLLHDIGKIAISDTILNKSDKLTENEWIEMKSHAEIGYRILSTNSDMTEIAEYVLAHHERWDGKGYPKGLKGEKIPLPSKICAIADAYDAMTSGRSYKSPLTKDAALAELRNNAETQFDPELVRVFIDKGLYENGK